MGVPLSVTERGSDWTMTGVLYAIAQFCVRRRFVVLGTWLVVTIALVASSRGLGENTNENLSLPGTDSQRATDTLARSFPDQSNGTSPIVLHAASGKLTDAKYADAVDQAAADVAKAPHVASVVNPLTPQGAAALSKDKSTGYLSVTLAVSPGELSDEGGAGRSSTPPIPRRPRACRSRPAASSARRSPSPRPSRAS